METSLNFDCPYCCSANNYFIDYSAGKHQESITDCEVCCRPIVLSLTLNADGIEDYYTRKENE